MLLQINCEPKLIASVSLVFDDNTTKNVDIRRGMIASFKYMSQGVSTEIFGTVSGVFLSPDHFCCGPDMPEPPKHLGYICDPNYVNSGFINKRPMPPKPYHPHHHHHHDMHDVRNYVEVIGAGKYAGQTKRIDIYSIIDIDVLYEDAKPVMTPDTFDKILLIRSNEGVMEYSTDGQEWVSALGSDYDELVEKVSDNAVELSKQDALINDLINRVKALEEAKEEEPTE